MARSTPVWGFTTKSRAIQRELINEVYVSEYFAPGAGDSPPQHRPYKALWDTGATNCVISRRVASELSLIPIGRVEVRGVGRGSKANLFETDAYLVNVGLPNKVELVGVRVSEGDVAGVDVLLGMDVISQGDFAISNRDGQTWWTFRIPSTARFDFVEEINRDKSRMGPDGIPLSRRERRKRERNRKRTGGRQD